MNFCQSLVLLSVFFALALAGHVHHKYSHDAGSGAVAVHYSVVTEHKSDYGGHNGHEKHHGQDAWGHDEDNKAGSHDGGHESHNNGDHDHYAYPKYDFNYGIKDSKTGYIKSHKETRDGSLVKGSYTIKEADGTTRHVEYTADKHTGFNAVVHTTGHAHAHPSWSS